MIYHDIITKKLKEKYERIIDISKLIAVIDIMIFCNITLHSKPEKFITFPSVCLFPCFVFVKLAYIKFYTYPYSNRPTNRKKE